jgi:formylglycine-generating enzyme required for sulfatase activity
MPEEINNQEPAKRRSGLWIGLAVGLALLVGLIAQGGCSQNSANSNTSNTSGGGAGAKPEPSPGTVVKNSSGMEFAFVPAGSFQMGSDKGSSGEQPVHQVTLARGFYMGRYEVTQAQWQKVVGSNPSSVQDCGENCPVDDVMWNDAQEFIKKLNAANDGYTYRLPSEAEWEYACRAGTTGDYAGDLNSMAWYHDNSNDKPHPVGKKQPNAWGLYDMHGNAEEWAMDYFHDNYNGAPTDGSAWLDGGEQKYRVVRGGRWQVVGDFLRSAFREGNDPDRPYNGYGIRLVAVPRL